MSERLTGKNDTKCSMSPWDWCGMDKNCKRNCFNPEPCKLPEKLRRLAEYEDLCFDADGNEVISLARLRKLAEAEREGRVVVLPCKVGQTFYGVNRDSGHIYEQVFDYAEVCLMEKSRDGKRGNRGYIVLDKGKKTKIYLDRKAAERALSEKGEATTCQ